MSENLNIDSTKLWDEIFKAIVDAMPEQLFPLFKEVYGKDYPRGTPITLLSTEYSTYKEKPDASPGSRLTDITLLVGDADCFHIECQMRNEKEMVIRMFAYDFHVAMRYMISEDQTSGELVMHFPRSTVIYPEKNRNLPEILRCRILFQDGSEHIYQIPTVRIQSYSLQEIREKHLTLFIPYVLLRLSPKLNPKRKHKLTKRELTGLVEEIILVLKEELADGYLTEREFDDYINLFRTAANRILKDEKHAEFRKEVDRMTKPLIELPSVREKRLQAEIDALRAEKAATDSALAEQNAEFARQFARQNAELAKMKELLEKHHIAIAP